MGNQTMYDSDKTDLVKMMQTGVSAIDVAVRAYECDDDAADDVDFMSLFEKTYGKTYWHVMRGKKFKNRIEHIEQQFWQSVAGADGYLCDGVYVDSDGRLVDRD